MIIGRKKKVMHYMGANSDTDHKEKDLIFCMILLHLLTIIST